MRPLQTVLFVSAFVILTTQTLRHVYVRFVGPRASVLDKFKEQVEKDITSATSLEELVSLYEAAHDKVKEIAKKEPTKIEDEYGKRQREPYKTEASLDEAIRTWESQRQEIYQLCFFCGCGGAILLLGLLCYTFADRWLGLGGIIGGFAEVIYWSSPSFRVFGSESEFDRLLTLKLVFSIVAWAILICLWLYSGQRAERSQANAN